MNSFLFLLYSSVVICVLETIWWFSFNIFQWKVFHLLTPCLISMKASNISGKWMAGILLKFQGGSSPWKTNPKWKFGIVTPFILSTADGFTYLAYLNAKDEAEVLSCPAGWELLIKYWSYCGKYFSFVVRHFLF